MKDVSDTLRQTNVADSQNERGTRRPVKRAVNLDGFINQAPVILAEADPTYPAYGAGVLNDTILEPLPQRLRAPSEQIINHGNSWITLGRDRPSSRASGRGGAGETGCSSIDLCVGLGGANPTADQILDPNFKADSARIYISQKTDIDAAFKTTKASGPGDREMDDSVGHSGIGIKADAVRIIGTNGIKLTTRTQAEDSHRGQAAYNGIELIALNDTTQLQYMVKGENLRSCLGELEERLNQLYGIVTTLTTEVLTLSTAIASHTHVAPQAPAGALTTLPSVSLHSAGAITSQRLGTTISDVLKARINLNLNWHNKYLETYSDKYILSKYNKVN